MIKQAPAIGSRDTSIRFILTTVAYLGGVVGSANVATWGHVITWALANRSAKSPQDSEVGIDSAYPVELSSESAPEGSIHAVELSSMPVHFLLAYLG
jgi:uncharacterized protein (DUF697 family)